MISSKFVNFNAEIFYPVIFFKFGDRVNC